MHVGTTSRRNAYTYCSFIDAVLTHSTYYWFSVPTRARVRLPQSAGLHRNRTQRTWWRLCPDVGRCPDCRRRRPVGRLCCLENAVRGETAEGWAMGMRRWERERERWEWETGCVRTISDRAGNDSLRPGHQCGDKTTGWPSIKSDGWDGRKWGFEDVGSSASLNTAKPGDELYLNSGHI